MLISTIVQKKQKAENDKPKTDRAKIYGTDPGRAWQKTNRQMHGILISDKQIATNHFLSHRNNKAQKIGIEDKKNPFFSSPSPV